MYKKHFLPLFFILLVSRLANAQEIPKHNVYFGMDSYEITPSVQQLLDAVYSNLPNGTSLIVGITGKLDNTKPKSYSNDLGSKRAKAAYDYLLSKGISANEISMDVYDKKHKKVNQSDLAATELYDFELFVKKAPAKAKLTYWYKKLNQEYPKKPNCFIINPSNISNLTSYEGTVISIPRYAFIYETGEMAENEVNICFLEFYKKSDMVMADINTVENGNLLQTGGILHIAATCNNRKVILMPPTIITVKFPTKKFTNGMRLFEGKEIMDNVEWQKTDIPNTSTNQQYYTLKLEQTGWMNCASPLPAPNSGTLTVTVDSSYKQDVKLVLKDMNTIILGEYITPTTVKFHNLPVGQKAYLVSYCYRNEIPAYTCKEITISSASTEPLELQETTYKDLQAILNSLQN